MRPPLTTVKGSESLKLQRFFNHCWNFFEPSDTSSGSIKCCVHFEKTVQKFLKIHLPYDLVIFPRQLYKRNKIKNKYEGLYRKMHSSKRTEAIQMSIDLWINKEIIVYLYNEMLLKTIKGMKPIYTITWGSCQISMINETSQWKMLQLTSFT